VDGLGKTDLDDLAKLAEQRLERGEEAQALSRHQVATRADRSSLLTEVWWLFPLGIDRQTSLSVERKSAEKQPLGRRPTPCGECRSGSWRKGPNMALILDPAAFQARLAALPVATYQVGETVLAAGTTSGRLLVLKTGAVEVTRDGTQIAEVSEPGAVFGELSMLLDQPHTADVRALEVTEFHVADAASLLTEDPATALYVTVLLARRLDATNRALIEVKRQLRTGEPRSTISRTVEKAEELLNYSGGASLVYAGYPYDPYESPAP
jgi:CRP/FNR family transcriptional regulator, cyclic AMP receptor protein